MQLCIFRDQLLIHALCEHQEAGVLGADAILIGDGLSAEFEHQVCDDMRIDEQRRGTLVSGGFDGVFDFIDIECRAIF
jgi:hypothetical protein